MIVGVYGGLAGLAVAMGPIVGGAITESDRLALDLLDQCPDRARRRAPRLRAATREPWRAGAARPRRRRAGHRRRRRARLGAHPRQRRRLGERRGRRPASRSAACCSLVFSGGSAGATEPMVPLRLFAVRDFAIGNLTTFLMSGAIFAGGLFSHGGVPTRAPLLPGRRRAAPAPVLRDADVRLAARRRPLRSDRPPADHRHRPELADGPGSSGLPGTARCATSWIELVVALLVAGIGISMALPTVPTAVLSAVAPHEMGKASGINYMAQRFGAVFAVAIGSTVFSTYGGLGSPGDRDRRIQARALGLRRVFAGLGGADRFAIAMSARPRRPPPSRARAPVRSPPEPTTQEPREGRHTMPNILHRLSIDAPPERVHQLPPTPLNLRSCQTLLPAFVAE